MMKQVFAAVLVLPFVAGACVAEDGLAKRVLLIGIDGVRPDALAAAATPNLDKLITEGAFADDTQILGDRYEKNDTISGPGWASILTGVWADKHGVHGNGGGGNKFKQYPDFFRRIEQSRDDAFTAALVTWRPLAEQLVHGADVSRNLKPKGSSDYATADTKAAAAAAKMLAEKDPVALFVYFGNVDNVGHARGFHPGVKPYVLAIERVDVLVGQVLTALRQRETHAAEDWLILVTTDHGGKGTNHQNGQKVPEVRQVFLIVSGQSAARGKISGPTYIVDVPVTALAHLGIAIDPKWNLDGRVVGLMQDASDGD